MKKTLLSPKTLLPLLLLACTDPEPVEPGAKVSLAFQSRLDGEFEPCG